MSLDVSDPRAVEAAIAAGPMRSHPPRKGESAPDWRRAVPQALDHCGVDDRSRPMCRPGSPRRRSASAGQREAWLAATETRQSPRAFAFDQRLEGLTNEGGFLLKSGEGLGLLQQFIVERVVRMRASWVGTQCHQMMRLSMPTPGAKARPYPRTFCRMANSSSGEPRLLA